MAPDTALTQVERLLQLIPLAGRPGGVPYDELAAALGIDRRQLDRDLEALTERDFYLPGGAVNDLQVILDEDRVHIWTTGQLRRPTRLSPGEAAALDLGLRILAAERGDDGPSDAMRDLLERIARAVPEDLVERVVADGDPGAADAIRALLVDAARRRRRVAVRYLKPDADDAEDRTVEPYVVAFAEGRAYAIGRDPEADGVRNFRVDRILEATVCDESFTRPADFDPYVWVHDGRVYRAAAATEVEVRYTGPAAPYLRERGEGETRDDGAVVVRHPVADPGWIVRHVLGYGPHAEVLGPESVRGMVAEAATAVVGRTPNSEPRRSVTDHRSIDHRGVNG